MSKLEIARFKAGTVFNKVTLSRDPVLVDKAITISYPSRLEAMALDPSKIAENNNLVYEAGQIDLCVQLFKHITVSVNRSGKISISNRTPRTALVLHAALIMKQALNISDGLDIDVLDEVNLRHCGLGSSSSLIAGVAAAINELYGKPIAPLDMVRYCAQNHGEEIDGSNDELIPVQCIGGSAVCGHYDGGLIILAGQATPIFTQSVSEDLSVVIGAPRDYQHPDSEKLMNDEVANIEGFTKAGKKYGNEIAYRLVHEVMPGLISGDLKACKSLIYNYRWKMGSIKNCSFVYPRMLDIAKALQSLEHDDRVELLSLSSVGPGFFALTSIPEDITDMFKKLDLETYTTKVHNGSYIINETEHA